MGGRGSLLQIPIVIAALIVGAIVGRYALSQGLHTVIASQPAPAKGAAIPSMEYPSWRGCALDSYGRQENALRCKMEVRAAAAGRPLVVHASKPIDTLTKTQSEEATAWFMVTAFAIPLALAGAAMMAYLIFRRASANIEPFDPT